MMNSYGSNNGDEVVLSVRDDSRPVRMVGNVEVAERQVVVDLPEANVIVKTWMGLVASMKPQQRILLSLCHRHFTVEAATELAKFIGLDLVATRIVNVEMSGINGAAVESQMVFVDVLQRHVSYRRLGCCSMVDSDIRWFSSLLTKESLKQLSLSNSVLSATNAHQGLALLKSAVIVENIPGSSHCRLEYISFSEMQYDDQDAAGNIVRSILEKCTSLIGFAYDCQSSPGGTERIAESIARGLSLLMLSHEQVYETFRYLDLQGLTLNRSFSMLSDHIVLCKNLKMVDLRNCSLIPMQNKKIAHYLGEAKRENPPTLHLDEWNDSDADDADDDDQFEFVPSQLY